MVEPTMVEVPGGTFRMGSSDFYLEERPIREVTVVDLFVDEHPVTNAAFAAFVDVTGWVTVAERPPAAEDFPDADPQLLVPGSQVFVPPAYPVPLDDWTRWWAWVPGAHWRQPYGPGSGIREKALHPVVHIGLEDALAYASWAGGRLATEAEWEHAARGGIDEATYAWGDEFAPGGVTMANTWHGRFPYENLSPHGFTRTSPVKAFPANGFGLFDVTGNVWEWTSSAWSSGETMAAPTTSCCGPKAQIEEHDRYVMKGGSHLCAPSYCHRYRPAARQAQGPRDTTSHLGFRVVRDA